MGVCVWRGQGWKGMGFSVKKMDVILQRDRNILIWIVVVLT